MHTRPLRVHHNNKHTHARTFNRTQACMHAQHDTRSTSSSMRLKCRERHRVFDRLTLSHYARSDSSLPYTFSHLTFKPLRTSCLPSRYILAYLPTQMILLMLSKDVACRHQLLSSLALIPL